MMDQELARKAADLITAHWRDGGQMAALPEALRPQDRQDGYAIQAHLDRRSSQPLFGWKIAATSEGGQRHIGVDGPLAGRLLAQQVIDLATAPTLNGNHMKVAEPEFAFRMAKTLPPRSKPYAVDDVLDAVGALHLAIELPSSRFLDFSTVGAAQLIADNACAHQFLLGPAVDETWRTLDLSQHKVIGIVAGKLKNEGSGGAVLGNPCIALTWLANELSSLGQDLVANQIVTTGTCTVPLPITPGDRVKAEFGRLGHIDLVIDG